VKIDATIWLQNLFKYERRGFMRRFDSSGLGYLQDILARRREFLLLVAIAVGIALGVDLVANALGRWTSASYLFIVGISLIALVALWLFVTLLGSVKLERLYEAAFLYDPKDNKILGIFEYDKCNLALWGPLAP